MWLRDNYIESKNNIPVINLGPVIEKKPEYHWVLKLKSMPGKYSTLYMMINFIIS